MADLTKPAPRRTGRPRKDEDRADAREQLLDAAHALMSERSSIDVPVKEISDRAGLNVALINYYFGGKDGLLLQLAMRHQANHAKALQRLLDAEDSAAAKLSLHIRGVVRVFRRAPYLQRLQHKILRDSPQDEARQVAAALVQPVAEFYRRLVAQAAADGSLRPVDPMMLQITVQGACDMLYSGSASRSYGYGVREVSDQLAADYADHLVSLVLNGLAPCFKGDG